MHVCIEKCGKFITVLHYLILDAIFSQKYHMNMCSIHNSYGDTAI
jgi:hypothetical protein